MDEPPRMRESPRLPWGKIHCRDPRLKKSSIEETDRIKSVLPRICAARLRLITKNVAEWLRYVDDGRHLLNETVQVGGNTLSTHPRTHHCYPEGGRQDQN